MITDPVILTAITQDVQRLLLLCHIAWPTGDVYTHTRTSQKMWDGRVWYGVGEFASISAIENGTKPGRLQLSLQINDQALLNEVKQDDAVGSSVKLYLAVLDENRRITAAQLVSHKTIADIGLSHDALSTLSIECAGIRERFSTAKDYTVMSAAEWRAKYPNDSYCDDIEAIAKGPLSSYSGSAAVGTSGGRGKRGVPQP
jgi:hypothetical protein